MTKVVFQNQAYWLRPDFWQEAEESGVDPMLVEWRNNKLVIRAITRDEFALRSGKRVAGWSVSAEKSVSVFMESLSPARRAMVIRHFQESLQIATQRVVKEFTARTGAQGKMRLPADVGLTIVVHVEAKNGAPQLHAHIAIDPRVHVANRAETYATHTRELYQLRKLYHSSFVQEFAHRLQKEFGVRVEKTPHGVRLPDVPRALCKLGSSRSHQIDAFLGKHGIKNTPVARSYGAFATRRDNVESDGRRLKPRCSPPAFGANRFVIVSIPPSLMRAVPTSSSNSSGGSASKPVAWHARSPHSRRATCALVFSKRLHCGIPSNASIVP